MLVTKTRFVIFCAAVISGLLTYSGFTAEVAPDDWYFKTVSALTATVITLAMSLFWAYAFAILPNLSVGKKRMAGWGTNVSGVLLIIAISTYWNLVFLAGGTVSQEMGKGIVGRAEKALAM